MPSIKNLLPAVLVLVAGAFHSCRKTDMIAPANAEAPSSGSPAAPVSASFKDTAAAYARDIYLWNDQIPATFNGGSFTDLTALMNGLRQYSAEPGFSGPVDKWSFAVTRNEWNGVSEGTVTGDYGMGVFFRSATDLRVKHVEPESAAGRAGIRRGWRILKINGSESFSSSNTAPVVQAVFQSNSAQFTFVRPDNSQVTLDLTAGGYHAHPIIKDTVLQQGSKRIGYFAFNAFMGDSSEVAGGFRDAFSRFAGAGINDLVVDLRYNGGGYVYMAEALANYIAPASVGGGLMMKQLFNSRNSRYNEDTYFHKQGSLSLPRVIFIVSKSTASASELLINNLRPWMDVVLVGPTATHGKPVGFFPIPVQDWYIFPVSFKTVNKNGEGSYYNGLSTNAAVPDGLDKDWGDPAEACLQAAISYSVNGSFQVAGRSTELRTSTGVQVLRSNDILDQEGFKGTVDERGLRQKTLR
jgi:carboxyl-terminal processing protease